MINYQPVTTIMNRDIPGQKLVFQLDLETIDRTTSVPPPGQGLSYAIINHESKIPFLSRDVPVVHHLKPLKTVSK
jgi:hypothetical protein